MGIGNRPIADLTPFDVLSAVRPFEAARNDEKAHRALQFIGSVCRFAVANQLATVDPTRDLRGALAKRKPKYHAAIIEPKRVGELLRAIDDYEGQGLPTTRMALVAIHPFPNGKPFALVQEAGIKSARMDINLRARDDTVRGVAAAAQAGDVATALQLLGGKVIEAEGTVVEQATKQWLSLPKSERDQTMIFASGRRLRDEVNTSVQEGLLQRGELGQQGLKLQVLDRVNLTNEELRYSHHYLPGRVLELGRPIREQRLGAGRYTVTEVDQNGRVELRDEHGKAHRFMPDRVRPDAKGASDSRLALYDQKLRTIYAGDQIRWTANDHERGRLNADRAKVTAIDKRQVHVETSAGMKLALPVHDPMLARIDLAYAYNAHMAQGMTADRAIVVMESRDTKLLTRQNFLVSVTRVRDDLTIFVNKADKARAKLELQSGEKTSALQTLGEVAKQPPELKGRQSSHSNSGSGDGVRIEAGRTLPYRRN